MDASQPPPTDETIADLVAGELPSAQAAALWARAATDPDLAARVAAEERLEARLRADGLLPVPVALVARTLDRLRAQAAPRARSAVPSRRARVLRALAAGLLVAVGAWSALGGAAPVAAVAEVLAPPSVPTALPAPFDALRVPATPGIPWPDVGLESRAEQALASVPAGPALLAGVAALSFAGGLWAARRAAHRGTPS